MYKDPNSKNYRTYATHEHEYNVEPKVNNDCITFKDININLRYLPDDYPFGYRYTEWYNNAVSQNNYLKGQKIDYKYDKKGNIIELYEYRIGANNLIERHIKIKYVEE